MQNMPKELKEQYYADTIIGSLHTILNCIEKINELSPNYDYIVDLAERVTKQLKSIADPE